LIRVYFFIQDSLTNLTNAWRVIAEVSAHQERSHHACVTTPLTGSLAITLVYFGSVFHFLANS
jgi:hypothetical protein